MHMRFADQHHARLAQTSNRGGVVVGDPMGENFGAGGGSDATRGEQVLDGNRDSMQRSAILSSAYFVLRFGRGLPAFLLSNGDEAVQLGLQLMDSLHRLIEQFQRRDFLSLEQWGQFLNGAGDESFRHGTLSRP